MLQESTDRVGQRDGGQAAPEKIVALRRGLATGILFGLRKESRAFLGLAERLSAAGGGDDDEGDDRSA